MRVEKLTDTRIENLKPPAKDDLLVWERSGLGVRVGLRRKTFLVQYRLHGRQHRLVLGHWPSLALAAARAKAAEALAKVDRGEDPAAEAQQRDEVPTLREFSVRYLEKHARIHKRSARGDGWMLKKSILPKVGDLRLDAIGRRELQRLHESMKETPYEANRCLSLLSIVFKLAEEWGEVPAGHPNPARGIRRYPEPPRERFLSEQELARLGDALRAHEADQPLGVAALRLLVFLGARKSEVLELRWSEIDLGAGCIRLPAERTKEKRAKVLPLSPPALEVLTKLPRCDNDLVFPGQRPGRPMSGTFAQLWDTVREAAALKDVRAHDLRHTFASASVGTGHSLVLTGALLGHRLPSTTQRYSHFTTDPVRAASNVIGARLAAALDAREPAEVVELHRSA